MMFRRYARVGRKQAGFTLIELMIALVLGLIVIAGVISVFLAGQQSYRTNQALGDVQDSARTAFELMARDIRDAGLTGCGNRGRVANVINSPTGRWWTDWNNVLYGYDGSHADPASGAFGTGSTARISGTDSLILLGAEASGVSVKLDTEPAGTITINEATSPLANGDVIVVCDPDHASIVQITGYSGTTITHAVSGTPGNCTKDLSYPTVCSSSSSYVFVPNSQIAKLTASDWYVGYNADGGKSLYRVTASGSGGTQAQEMVRGVTGMSIGYHASGAAGFVAAGSIANWALVDAVQVTFTLESTDAHAGVGATPIKRTFTTTTTVRNRVS